jgi:hypothetical protein
MYDERKELKDSQVEKEILEQKNDLLQINMADELINRGVGEEIIKTLNNPYKITKLQLFKIKMKSAINRIFDVL